jgi:hypothetical protein
MKKGKTATEKSSIDDVNPLESTSSVTDNSDSETAGRLDTAHR